MLETRYLGFALPHPFMAGASPLSEDLDGVRRLEDAGAAAIVLPSLYEEQIREEQRQTVRGLEEHSDAFVEAHSYLPEPPTLAYGAEHYLEHVRRAKAAVRVPVIASLNGVTDSGWLDYGRLIQEAGADALELNVYFVATDPGRDSQSIECELVAVVSRLKRTITIPLAVKLSPFFSSVANLGRQLDGAGADGLILFNRFFQPDIDIDAIAIRPALRLSDRSELALRLAWLGILAGRTKASLAASGGVHACEDAIKALMAGADAVQMVSGLLRGGVERLAAIRGDCARWLEEHEYDSLAQLKGSMSLARCPDPQAYERVSYMRLLQTWRP